MKTLEQTIEHVKQVEKNLDERVKQILEALRFSVPEEVESWQIFYAYSSGWAQADPKFGGGWVYDSPNGRIHLPHIPSPEQIYNINKDIEKYFEVNNLEKPEITKIELKEKSRIIIP